MIRRHHAPRFGEGETIVEDVDPRVGLVNLADIMLVLAVALMLAVMANNGFSSANAIQIDSSSLESIDAEDTTSASEDSDSSEEKTYEEVGSVYRDTETGDLYVVQN